MSQYIALTVVTENNKHNIYGVTEDGLDVLEEEDLSNRAEAESLAREMAKMIGIPSKRDYMIYQRVNQTPAQKAQYLESCRNHGAKVYSDYSKNNSPVKIAPSTYFTSKTFSEEGWEAFLEGWAKAYNENYPETIENVTQVIEQAPSPILVNSKLLTEYAQPQVSNDNLLVNGTIVSLHIGRWRAVLSLTDLGLSDIKLLSKERENNLDRIEQKARGYLEIYSVKTPWGNFIPNAAFKTWYEKTSEIKQEFFSYVLDTIESYRNEISPYISHEREAILAKLPSAQDILDAFNFELVFSELPLSSFSSFVPNLHPETTEDFIRQTILREHNDTLSFTYFYKSYYTQVLTELNSKLSLNLASLLKIGYLKGKSVISLNSSVSIFRLKSQDSSDDIFLCDIITCLNAVDEIMAVKSSSRDFSKLAEELQKAINCCQRSLGILQGL